MPRATPSETTTIRGVSLGGDSAVAWLAAHGVHALDASGLRLSTDVLETGEFHVSRIWHTALDARVRTRGGSPWLSLLVDGEVTMTIGGRSQVVEPGDIVVMTEHQEFDLSARRWTARIEVRTPLIRRLAESVRPGTVLHRPPNEYRSSFVSLVNATLNSPISPSHIGFSSAALSIGHLTAAMLTHALAHAAPARSDSLHARAAASIDRHAADPQFTLSALAHDLGVSDRVLRLAFARHGTSPLLELRRARVELARSYFDARAEGERLSVEQIARMSGFSNAQALRRAIAAVERSSS